MHVFKSCKHQQYLCFWNRDHCPQIELKLTIQLRSQMIRQGFSRRAGRDAQNKYVERNSNVVGKRRWIDIVTGRFVGWIVGRGFLSLTRCIHAIDDKYQTIKEVLFSFPPPSAL